MSFILDWPKSLLFGKENSVPNNKVIDFSELKAFANNLIVPERIFSYGMIEGVFLPLLRVLLTCSNLDQWNIWEQCAVFFRTCSGCSK